MTSRLPTVARFITATTPVAAPNGSSLGKLMNIIPVSSLGEKKGWERDSKIIFMFLMWHDCGPQMGPGWAGNWAPLGPHIG